MKAGGGEHPVGGEGEDEVGLRVPDPPHVRHVTKGPGGGDDGLCSWDQLKAELITGFRIFKKSFYLASFIKFNLVFLG